MGLISAGIEVAMTENLKKMLYALPPELREKMCIAILRYYLVGKDTKRGQDEVR